MLERDPSIGTDCRLVGLQPGVNRRRVGVERGGRAPRAGIVLRVQRLAQRLCVAGEARDRPHKSLASGLALPSASVALSEFSSAKA